MKTTNNFEFINTEYLDGVSKNTDFIKKIISLFKVEIKVYKENMPQLLIDKNYKELAKLTHKAKSSISILGMMKQADDLKKIETDIRNSENYETLEKRINNFLDDCEQAVSEIIIFEETL
ncbi:MAG: hypothetical protein L3J56_07375 [Bacteroidales bacterium]|nr:hypothetical protein [Bacteroidales bacterium]